VESLTALFPGGFSLLLQASLFRFYERVGIHLTSLKKYLLGLEITLKE
jgi:hypothetical protein